MKPLLTTILLIQSVVSFSQTKDTIQKPEGDFYWAALGGGISFLKNSALNFNLVVGADYLIKNKYLIQINFIGITNVTKAFVFNNYENNVDRLGSLVLTYGISKSINRLNSFNISAGPSYSEGVYFGKDTATNQDVNWILPFLTTRKINQETFKTFGFFISGQYLLRTRFYGLGVRLYCNIHKHTDWGISLTHNLGYLNKRKNDFNLQ